MMNIGPALRGGGGDSYFGNVRALLHGEAFTDVKGHTVAALNGATINGSVPKFGAGCMDFSATNNAYASVSPTIDLSVGAGDFTLEFFVRLPLLARYRYMLRLAALSDIYLYCVTSSMTLTTYVLGNVLSTSGVLVANTWSHVAICRSGTTVRVFLDGALVHTSTIATDMGAVSAMSIGGFGGANTENCNGQIDDLRLTVGVARYSTAFAPPAAPFPDN